MVNKSFMDDEDTEYDPNFDAKNFQQEYTEVYAYGESGRIKTYPINLIINWKIKQDENLTC